MNIIRIPLIIIGLFATGIIYRVVMPEREKPERKIHVVCTTTMIADAVRRIGDPYLEIMCLMGPGVDPHLYRARAGAIDELASADLILYHGLHLEGKMADILQAIGRQKMTVAAAEVIPQEKLISSDFPGIYDPHVWHDVALWMHVVHSIAEALCAADPVHAGYFKNRSEEYVRELQELDKEIHGRFEKLADDERILVTAHDAFAYFGRAYNIKVVALQGMNTDAQISPRDVTRLATFIIEHKIATIFFESSIPRRTMDAVKEAVQSYGGFVAFGQELYSDALGDSGGPQGTYVSMMRSNCNAILHGLQHKRMNR